VLVHLYQARPCKTAQRLIYYGGGGGDLMGCGADRRRDLGHREDKDLSGQWR